MDSIPAKLSPEALKAISAARQAGEKIIEIYRQDFDSSLKDDKSPITLADTESDRIIYNILAGFGYPILSEETKDDELRLSRDKVWIVDPLDGTSDFVNKIDNFSVMIALVENHVPILGVIYNPVTKELYLAQKGLGAFKQEIRDQKSDIRNNWQKISVSQIINLSKVRAVVSRFHFSEKDKNFLKKLGVKNFINHGSAGLKAALVADGKADLYFNQTGNMRQWDTAAAHCLISEAGGKITDMLGQELIYNTGDIKHKNGILITNGKIHSQAVEAFKAQKSI